MIASRRSFTRLLQYGPALNVAPAVRSVGHTASTVPSPHGLQKATDMLRLRGRRSQVDRLERGVAYLYRGHRR